ncbi:MAG: tetratricopeptide repeat protein, partial [Verrucomicrobiota bacterium]
MKKLLFTPIKVVLLASILTVHASTLSAAGASPSELLEKGIYSEETKGDLEAAIVIYQQLISEVKAGESLAAKAQFRLAQCYLKKNRPIEAAAAFEKLIRDYPNEKELVLKARSYLPGEPVLVAVPWEDGERLQFSISLPGGQDIGAMIYRADAGRIGGRKIWKVGARMFAGANSYSQVEVDEATFHPINSRWKHSLLGDVSAVYTPGEVILSRLEKPGVTNIAIDEPVYDNEQAMHLIRRLPLAPGYKTSINIFSTHGGGTIPIGVEVVAREPVTVPAGQFDCFKAHLSVNQTFWYADDARRTLIKFEGGGIVAQLVSSRRQIAGQPVHFSDPELGVSLSAPADWSFQQRPAGTERHQRSIFLLDPEARADRAMVRLIDTESLSKSARASARSWAEEDFAEHASKSLKEAVIRPDSWKNQLISGRPGVSYVIDFTAENKACVGMACYALGGKVSEYLAFTCKAEQFEVLR